MWDRESTRLSRRSPRLCCLPDSLVFELERLRLDVGVWVSAVMMGSVGSVLVFFLFTLSLSNTLLFLESGEDPLKILIN